MGDKQWEEYGRDRLVMDRDAQPAGARMAGSAAAIRERDDDIRAEIRALVIARNHRRARSGHPPLDVEAEVAREIEALSKLT